jgi:xanthine dehydrogenase/oxidase
MYGMAVLSACEQICERLAPYRAKGEAFTAALNTAYFQRVNLSAQGFYKMHVTGYDFTKELAVGSCNSARGRPFAYFTFGAGCSEVEIDCLTGDMRVLRADVLMDVGNSLNPAIDVGQIEGAFLQGRDARTCFSLLCSVLPALTSRFTDLFD